MFIAERVLDAVIARVGRARRPGGWLLVPVLRAKEGSLDGSVVRLRAALWGRSALTIGEADARLAAAGLVDLQSCTSGPTSTTALLAAHKAAGAR